MTPSRSRWLLFATLTPLLTGFDLWSKRAAVDALGTTPSLPIHGDWLSLVHAENTGAAFSSPIPQPLLLGAAVLAFGFMVHWLRSAPGRGTRAALAAALVVGGGLGNTIDRIPDGSVTDFIRVSAAETSLGAHLMELAGTATWPIFNLADIWLVVGMAGVLLLHPAAHDRSAGQAAPQG